jgi:hypothetical protein
MRTYYIEQYENVFLVTVNNKNDVWESDLVDVQCLRKYNNGVKYRPTVIDVLQILTYRTPKK